MRYWKNPDEEAERAAWYAKQDHFRYPDDLPFPRRMRYGPHTPEVASRYLDADYPLPGSFPPPQPKTEGNAAWYDFLKTKVVYPGAKLSGEQAAERKQLVEEFAATGYTDMELAGYLHGFDRETGYSPIFQFQYHVLNFSKYGSVMFFKLNGITHTLHWHKDWKIDQKSISEYWDEAEDDFYLFKLVGYCLFDKKFGYPVIEILHIHSGNPESILAHIPVGPVSDTVLSLFVRRNPDPNQEEQWAEELKQLEGEFFNQPRWMRHRDLRRINELRQKFGLPGVNEDLKPLNIEAAPRPEIKPILTAKVQDPHQEARAIYNIYLQKERELEPHRRYCRRIIQATAPHNGHTPIEPLATMGTDGGPLLCDFCGDQIPLEGGPYNGVGARDAWERGARGYSFILGGVVFMQEDNGTLRVYHDYRPPCRVSAERREELKRKDAGSKGSWNYDTQEKVRAFIRDTLPDAEPGLLNRIRISLYGYDPGIGINQP